MFAGIRTLDLDFNSADLHAVGYFDPGVASQRKRIHRVGNHRSTDSEVVLGNRVANAVPCIVERLVNHPGRPDGLLDRIDTQMHGTDLAGELPGYSRLSGPW